MKNIDYGIDLGTTNSGIAKYSNGKVNIYKNPIGFNDLLPSVVAYRKGRVFIGDKAREQIIPNSANVMSSFKRKMGSDETFYVEDTGATINAIELSSLVIKELLSFVPESPPVSCVITIPASFDTMQSNATIEAGYMAGLKEVSMLQEPIAACIAYANGSGQKVEDVKNWLVYDFGGGTFDVALVYLDNRELKVLDHKGNNFLGGVDIDNGLLEKVICPKLNDILNVENSWAEMNGDNKPFRTLRYELLLRTEEAKKELSLKETSLIEFEFNDEYYDVELCREELNQVVRPKFEESFTLLNDLLEDNGLTYSSVEKIILVGGTTYIPYIRNELSKRTSIEIDHSLDPTTAVINGAAFYAGNKMSSLKEEVASSKEGLREPATQNAKVVYEPFSNDAEELISARLEQPFSGFYRITRNDGGFDTGMVSFDNTISEFVPLLSKTNNSFHLYIYDNNNNVIHNQKDIHIAQGLYKISGQPLPNDICLELDERRGGTYLEVLFKRNETLPLQKKVYKTISKTILRNSEDNLIINIIEGDRGSTPNSNLNIGFIEIKANELEHDLLVGTDIELDFKISESRELEVGLFIDSANLELKQVFNPSRRTISQSKLLKEIENGLSLLAEERKMATMEGNGDLNTEIKELETKMLDQYVQLKDSMNEIDSDKKFIIDDKKRKILGQLDKLVRLKNLKGTIDLYQNFKGYVMEKLNLANPMQKEAFQKIVRSEKEIFNSGNKILIQNKIDELDKLNDQLDENSGETWVRTFVWHQTQEESEYRNARKYRKLTELGATLIEQDRIKELRAICGELYDLLKVKPNWGKLDTFEGNLGIR